MKQLQVTASVLEDETEINTDGEEDPLTWVNAHHQPSNRDAATINELYVQVVSDVAFYCSDHFGYSSTYIPKLKYDLRRIRDATTL